MVYSKILFLTLAAAWQAAAQEPAAIRWESGAQFHQALKKTIPGTLAMDNDGIEFRSPKVSLRWPYGEIKTFDLTENRELVITDYGNRHWHEPGERTFRFVLAGSMPSAIASGFASRVQRPVINGVPVPATDVLAELPAHQKAFIGGSNGRLQFRRNGIDYLASDGRSSRTWRWSDIQTIANPSPWEFRVTAYREVVEFDLKQPLSREVFDRLWNILYASDLNLAPGKGDHRP